MKRWRILQLQGRFGHLQSHQKGRSVGRDAIDHDDLDHSGAMSEFKDETKFCTSIFTRGPQSFEASTEFLHGGTGRYVPEEIPPDDSFWRQAG